MADAAPARSHTLWLMADGLWPMPHATSQFLSPLGSLNPRMKAMQAQPTVSHSLIHHIQRGDVIMKPNVSKFEEVMAYIVMAYTVMAYRHGPHGYDLHCYDL